MAESAGVGYRGLGRRLTSLSAYQRRATLESPEELKGPLGLRVQFEPKDAFIELVFVHGFPGGSRRTWSFGDDTATYWPREWLPQEPGFDHIRIYTFGYDISAGERRIDVAKIKPIGRSLLDYIASDIHFRKNDRNPIVFVAHSLGGLVVKQAFIDARQNPRYHNISQRIHSLIFLSTPHHGLDSAIMVTNILRACNHESRNQHVELEPNFAVIEEINRQFQQHYDDTVKMHCYYELEPMPGTKTVVIDRNAAALPFANIEPTPLMAHHRSVASFESTSDAVYSQVRNRLEETAESIISDLLDPENIQDQMRLLGDYLGVSEGEEEELNGLDPVSGSCEWLTQSDNFLRWKGISRGGNGPESDLRMRMRESRISLNSRVAPSTSPRFFWLTGAPGSGKSVLAAHVIRHLGDLQCSYYFLKHSDRSKQNFGHLLRSIAYQMASKDVGLRQSFLSMQQDGTFTAEVNDVRAIWKQLFQQKIFRAGLQQKQYWVIDALDEGISSHEFIELVSKIPSQVPIQVFITSRRDFQIEKLFKTLPIISRHIDVSDTIPDIRLYLNWNRDSLHADEAGIEDLVEQLVAKSQGSFLWIRLVLQRLEDVWADVDIEDVLKEVPDGMNELYNHILLEMSHGKNKDLANAILRWTICASRPLNLGELQEAIYRDIGSRVRVMDKMIEDVCGQLVVVGRQGKVQLVHDTVRDFLLDPRLESEFAIDKASAHSTLADVCLRYLNEAERKVMPGSQTYSSLHEYAHLYFSDHVIKGRPADSDTTTLELTDFLNSQGVLHWIQFVVKQQDLNTLTQTAKNLKAWVERRRDFQSPLSGEMSFVQEWTVDLIRLVTVFGKDLLANPACIHTVIPPLCPTASKIYERFGRSHLGLEVVGLADRGWADKIFSESFHDDWTLSVGCCETHYGIGLRSGTVVLYHASTCQRSSIKLNHGEPVKRLEFSSLHSWIVTSGLRKISLWNYETGEEFWSVTVSSEPMALGFLDEDSVVVSAERNNRIVFRNTRDGADLNSVHWHANQAANTQVKQPMKVVMSTELGLVAVIYRNQPVLLLDLANLSRPRYFGGQSTVLALAFNAPQKAMAVSFFHGELSTYNLSNLQKGEEIQSDAHHLVVSVDGKTLLVGDKVGRVHIHDFESLKLFHAVRAGEDDILSIAFAPNSLRFLDVRRKEFNLWEPTSLVRRKDNEDSTSQGHTSFSTAPTELVQAYVGSESTHVTALAVHDRSEYVFCGKDDGTVAVYDTSRGRRLKVLFDHSTVSVSFLDWNAAQSILISSDRSSLIKAHRIQQLLERGVAGPRYVWKATLLFSRRVETTIRQILSTASGEYLLVSDLSKDVLWNMKGEDVYEHQCRNLDHVKNPSQRWTLHPKFKRRLFEVHSNGVHAVQWTSAQPPSNALDLSYNERIDLDARDTGVHFGEFSDNMWTASDNNPISRPILWESAPSISPAATKRLALDYYNGTAPDIQTLIGLYQSQLVFLNNDGWISSMFVSERGQDRSYQQHFPIPHCWKNANRRMVAVVSSRGDVIIAKGDELAIVKSGLNLGGR